MALRSVSWLSTKRMELEGSVCSGSHMSSRSSASCLSSLSSVSLPCLEADAPPTVHHPHARLSVSIVCPSFGVDVKLDSGVSPLMTADEVKLEALALLAGSRRPAAAALSKSPKDWVLSCNGQVLPSDLAMEMVLDASLTSRLAWHARLVLLETSPAPAVVKHDRFGQVEWLSPVPHGARPQSDWVVFHEDGSSVTVADHAPSGRVRVSLVLPRFEDCAESVVVDGLRRVCADNGTRFVSVGPNATRPGCLTWVFEAVHVQA